MVGVLARVVVYLKLCWLKSGIDLGRLAQPLVFRFCSHFSPYNIFNRSQRHGGDVSDEDRKADA